MKTILENVRKNVPLVHFITNYVTVNDVANMMLASGGSPIMSDEILDVEDITSICNATVLNIGTLNQNTIESMIAKRKESKCNGSSCHFRSCWSRGIEAAYGDYI